MTTKNINHRMAMTAIAAVIAFSSTPTFAQDASAPEPATETPEATTSDPLAPDPVATTTETPATDSPVADAAPPAAKPKVETARAKAASSTRRIASATRASSSRTASSSASAAPALAATPAAEALQDTVPPPVIPEAAGPVATPPVQAEPASGALAMDDELPIAAGAGLGLLALAGFGLAARRRRRRREEEEYEANQWALAHAEAEPEPEPAIVRPEAAFARTQVQQSARQPAPALSLPAGFDISRFGPHVQAAYRGPTPDNPSLSLKNRLRRASFFDQQERRVAGNAMAAAPKPQPAWMSRKPNESEFMFRPVATKPDLKPALRK